jgi:hypothetical protein
MEITQIQVSYLELEDRVIMRINLGENKHVAFLLTRRICRFMLENLNAFLGVSVQNALAFTPVIPPLTPQASPKSDKKKDVLAPFAGLDHQTPFQERKAENNILRTGHDKELVVNAACNRGQDGVSFTFFIQDAESLNLNLPRQLALGIHQLLSGVAVQAQWFSGLTQLPVGDASQVAEDVEQTKTSVTYH